MQNTEIIGISPILFYSFMFNIDTDFENYTYNFYQKNKKKYKIIRLPLLDIDKCVKRSHGSLLEYL